MDKKKEVLFLRPRDKSLEAFKAWISVLMVHLTGEERDNFSEEQWRAYWQKFWASDDASNAENELRNVSIANKQLSGKRKYV